MNCRFNLKRFLFTCTWENINLFMNVNFLHAHILLTYRLILPFFLLILNIIQNLLNWVLVPIWSAIFSIVFRHRLVIFIQRALFQLMRFLNYFFLLELWPHNFIQPEVLSPPPLLLEKDLSLLNWEPVPWVLWFII